MSSALSVLNAAGFLLNAVATGLAQSKIQPFGVVAGKYISLLSPEKWAFSIWGVIFPWQALLTVAQLFPPLSASDVLIGFGPWWFFACLSQSCWALAFSSERIELSMIFMAGIVLGLGVALWESRDSANYCSLSEFWLLLAPISLHFGWIVAAATVGANILVMKWAPDDHILLGFVAVASCLGILGIGISVGLWLKAAGPLAVGAMAWALLASADRVRSSGTYGILSPSVTSALFWSAAAAGVVLLALSLWAGAGNASRRFIRDFL
ncbi:unnamed protein product [Prorocentrum cordatum]|uniref:Uncharacterized protein n=1 Tax=Prorocentrum cordatum TaxID=2364126 RepID=A0ABN9YCA6_9DINO|nr:unnamed protein product [Polarella glacialis]